MSSAAPPQDLPPSSGYSRIIYEKTNTIRFFNGKRFLLLYVGCMSYGFWGIGKAYRERLRHESEQKSGEIAIQPFLIAEQDRALLKQIRKNRDAEAELMKNVKGWEVGTFFGASVYNTPGPDQYLAPLSESFHVHADPDELRYRRNFQWWF